MNQVINILSLYSEVFALMIGASLLGWFVGFMMRGAGAKYKLKAVTESWQKRYKTLEETTRTDIDNLEEQLQSTAQESKNLQLSNNNLTETLKKNESSILKARNEAVELNRQNAETQERLQRIIRQKDREIVELGNRLNGGSDDIHSDVPTSSPSSESESENISEIIADDLHHADTIAINPGVIPGESFDATMQISVQEMRGHLNNSRNTNNVIDSDAELDATTDLSSLGVEDAEEPTVALDDDALAFAQRSYPARRRGE
ncbi:MAG: DUF2570 domain-containing protein [Granulosicoccus sp.]|nr:DUF2570 domain-containing protein [Granulosicoccus sp.]